MTVSPIELGIALNLPVGLFTVIYALDKHREPNGVRYLVDAVKACEVMYKSLKVSDTPPSKYTNHKELVEQFINQFPQQEKEILQQLLNPYIWVWRGKYNLLTIKGRLQLLALDIHNTKI